MAVELLHARSMVRVGVAATAGAAVGAAVAVLGTPVLGPLIGWDAAALIYVAWAWISGGRLDAAATARLARREDPGRAVFDLLLVVAAIGSLAAVAVLIAAGSSGGPTKQYGAALGIFSVVASWTLVHTVFTGHYARLYYSEPRGGIDFHQTEPPTYADFAYVAFTIGMTFQVSDTDLGSSEMRSAVLRHALLSYLLGAIIIAATVNVLAGIAG